MANRKNEIDRGPFTFGLKGKGVPKATITVRDLLGQLKKIKNKSMPVIIQLDTGRTSPVYIEPALQIGTIHWRDGWGKDKVPTAFTIVTRMKFG